MSQGFISVAKRDFFSILWNAWEASFTSNLILRAFEATGLPPLNPYTILKRYRAPDSASSQSSGSVLGDADWRQLSHILEKALRGY